MTDFEAVDVWCLCSNRAPLLRRHAPHIVYVQKITYDSDLLPGQQAVADVYAQLSKDIPRSRVFMNGSRITRICPDIPVALWRYCTQAVMALPVELLLRSFAAVVAERLTTSPLRIEASTRAVIATKKLDIRTPEDDDRFPVTITVCASVDDPNVVIVFDFA